MNYFEIKQAVVGFEFGQTDENLLTFLQYLSSRVPIANAHFLHVIPTPQLLDAFYESLAGRFDLKAGVLERLKKKIGAQFAKEGMHNTFATVEGDPLKEVLHAAEEKEADLVVIGQKADTRKHGILAKSLARRVKGNALVVPEKATVGVSSILVPIDFSPNSTQAFQTALALKKQLPEKVQITCIHVFELPNLRSYDLGRSPEQFRKLITKSRLEAFQKFIKTHAPEEEGSIPTVLIEKTGPGLAHYITDYIEQEEIDFVVIGAKGHSTVERLLLGSVTEKLLSLNEKTATLVVR